MEIGGHDFEGPYKEEELQDRPGVYVVLDEVYYRGKIEHMYIYVGESDRVLSSIADHDDRDCWDDHQDGMRVFAVLYMDGLNVAHRYRITNEVGLACSPSLPCPGY